MHKQIVASGLVFLCAGPALARDTGPYAGYKGGRYWVKEFGRQDREWAHGPYAGKVVVVSLCPTLPVTPGWELYAKLGWAWVDGDFQRTPNSPAGAPARNRTTDDALFGIGTRWSMGPVKGRLEYQFDASKGGYNGPDLGFATVGIEYQF